ncbi:MAG: lyase family protein [Candidatus Parcubacteria bacterium]|nr:lyase family protein [Candidatus Parcubacteria bacterium]
MIKRYLDQEIDRIWSNEQKLARWQDTELAVIQTRSKLGTYPSNVYDLIANTLKKTPIDIKDWLAKEEKTRHDLNAFLLERTQHLERALHQYFHDSMTSYDTEEAPMSLMLLASISVVERACNKLFGILIEKVKRYQCTPMLGRTHGQEAKLQSFGKRVFTWYKKMQLSFNELAKAKEIVLGKMLIRAEDSEEVAYHFAAEALLATKILTYEDMRQIYQKISAVDIMRVARKYLVDERMGLAVIGPKIDEKKTLKLLSI